MKQKASKNTQSEIKAKNLKTTLKKSGLKTQMKGHLKASNQRKQASRDSRG